MRRDPVVERKNFSRLFGVSPFVGFEQHGPAQSIKQRGDKSRPNQPKKPTLSCAARGGPGYWIGICCGNGCHTRLEITIKGSRLPEEQSFASHGTVTPVNDRSPNQPADNLASICKVPEPTVG